MSKYKVGDKFVCEIKEVIASERGTLYRSDFSTLVFDDYGLDNLPQLIDGVNEACYNKGLEDMWEVLKTIADMDNTTCEDLFGNHWMENIIKTHTPQEILAKLREWEECIKEIKLGDEVKGIVNFGIVIRVGVKYVSVMWHDGSSGDYEKKNLTKTGRNFADELDALLSAIGGQPDDV